MAWVAAFAFTIIQGVGMAWLLDQHFSASDGSMKVFGMSFTLAMIHALHVIGGMAFLGFVIYQAYQLLAFSGRRLGLHAGRVLDRTIANPTNILGQLVASC